MTVKKELRQEDMPNDQFNKLCMEELKIGAKFTPNQYAELILGHLVQNKPIQAKFCYTRAVERIEGSSELIKQVWAFGQHIYTKRFVEALGACKNTHLDDQSLQHYVIEIRNRLVAKLLELIARTYTSLSLKKFSEVLCLADDRETSELLIRCMWPVENNWIKPVQNAGLYKTLSDLCNLKYGPADSDTSEANYNKILGQINLENLAAIVKSSVFFDAMETTNPISGAGGNTNN
uniref:CSN8/PSMD8/EIF3K domain-containing protein n=1 Tax=Meloidogyne javanica TaxID=6303 RepID=A0A915M1P4_MELJA